MLSFFPLDVLDEIWDVIESGSEGFLTYFLKAVSLFALGRIFQKLLPYMVGTAKLAMCPDSYDIFSPPLNPGCSV